MINTIQPEPLNSPPSVPPSPLFPRATGETPRACSAFITFFQLGHARSLQAVAEQLGEGLPTIKNWSSRFGWYDRVQAFNSGLLQQHVHDHAALSRLQTAAWTERLEHLREQEWDAAQKLLNATQCFLETLGGEDLRRMTLAQVARALKTSSAIARLALAGAELPQSNAPASSPAQDHLLAGIRQVYALPDPKPPGQTEQHPANSADSPLNPLS